MKFKKMLAAVLAATMLATVAGCSGVDKSWAAQLGEEKISAGVHSLNVITAISQAMTLAGVQDDTVFTATVDGKVGAQFINDYARDESARQLAAHKKFVELGLTMTDADKTDYENYAKQTFEADPELYTSNGISEQSLTTYNRYLVESYMVFNALYAEGGEKAVPADEQLKAFSEAFYTAYVVPYAKMDAGYQPLAQEELDKVIAKSDADLKAITEGKNITDVVYETSNANLPEGTAAEAKGEDKQYTMIVRKDGTDGMPAMLLEQLGKAAVGSTELVEDDMYRLIIQKLDENKTPDDIIKFYYATKLLQPAKNDEYRALQLQWAQEVGVTYNDATLKEYSGEKVKKNMDKYFKKLNDAASKSAADLSQSSSQSASSEGSSTSSEGSSVSSEVSSSSSEAASK